MIEYEAVNLRLKPDAIPAVRAAFEKVMALLQPEINKLGQVDVIHEPWLGDPKSEEVRVVDSARVMQAEDGPYPALVLYLKEPMRVRDQLKVTEQEYQRAEAENSDMFGQAL